MHCGQTLDMSVADILAVRLTPTEAVAKFLAQTAVPRRGMNETELAIYRTFVVAKEAISDTPSDAEQELLGRLKEGWKATERERQKMTDLERIGAELERLGSVRRSFYRRADRLWRQQRSRLKAAIYDDAECEAALSALGQVYVRIFREALEQEEETHRSQEPTD